MDGQVYQLTIWHFKRQKFFKSQLQKIFDIVKNS